MPDSVRFTAAAVVLLAAMGVNPMPGSAGVFLSAPARAAAPSSLEEGQALYAQLLMSLQPTMNDQQLTRLTALADRALAAAPGSADARLLKAGAIWLKSRQTGKMMSFFKGYPQDSRQLLNEAVRIAPDNARGHGYLASWHIDVFRRGGDSGAKRLGANFSTGLAEWDRAVALAPGDITLMVHGAFTLLASSNPAARTRGTHALDLAINGRASDPLSQAMQQRARRLRTLLAAGNRAQIDAEIARWVGS